MVIHNKYNHSGIEWIGEIPNHWEVKRLKYLIRERITDGPHETPEFIEIGIPFLSVDSIQNGEIDFNDTRKISESEHERFKLKCKAERNDILMGKAASIGKIAQVKVDFEFSIWSPLALIKPSTGKITSNYLEYYLKSQYSQYEIIQLSSFNTQRNISMADIPRINIVLPPIKEQILISAYLDTKTSEIDHIIANKQKLIALYEEEKQEIINHTITHGVEPNSIPLKFSGVEWMGNIPAHWKIKKLGHIGQCQNGINISADSFGSGYPFVSYGDVYKNMCLPENVDGLVNSTEKDRDSYSVKEEDVFFTRTSETSEEIGFASVCMKTIEFATFAGFLIRFRPNPGVILKSYSKYYFRCKLHRFYFVKEMNLVTRASLSQGLLKNLIVLCPPLEEQAIISLFLDQECDRLGTIVEKCKKQIELLKEYRTTLISEVVTGKVKV